MIYNKNLFRLSFRTINFLGGIIVAHAYYKAKKLDKKFNIVFDIDETLVSTIEYEDYANNIGLKKPDFTLEFPNDDTGINEIEYYGFTRPFTKYSLYLLSKFANIHIMTRSKQIYADQILERVNIDKYIQHKKYRSDCGKQKDLTKFINNSDRSECSDNDNIYNVSNYILVDNDISNRLNRQNFYHIDMYSHHKCMDFGMARLTFYMMIYLLYGIKLF